MNHKTNMQDDDMAPNQRRALSKGLAALETMADLWSVEVRLAEMSQRIAAVEDQAERAKRIEALIHLGFVEGAYRHFLDHKGAQARAAAPQADERGAVEIFSKLHKFLNAAGAEGLVLDGIDGGDLFMSIFDADGNVSDRVFSSKVRALAFQELFEFQEATGFDTAEEYRAAAPQAEAAQGVPEGWTGNHEADSALIMLDRLDVSSDDDVRVDAISAIVRKLAAAPAPVSEPSPDREHEVPCAKLVGRWDYGKPGCVRYEPDFPRGDIPEGTPVYVGSAPSPDREQVGKAEPIAWIRFCGDGLYEGPIMNCDRRKMDEIVRVKPDEWRALVLRNDSTQENGCLTRKSMQEKALEHGFEYWRVPDEHGITGTKPQCIEFLQDLLGVEVEIEDNGCQTCNGTGVIGGPSFYAPDEGGEPCPDCCDTPSYCSSVRRCTAKDASPSRECGERHLSNFERTVLEYIAFNEGFINTRMKAREMLDGTSECGEQHVASAPIAAWLHVFSIPGKRTEFASIARDVDIPEDFVRANQKGLVTHVAEPLYRRLAPTLSDSNPTAESPRWYSVDEIRSRLKSMAYGDEIADELSTWITTEMQLAFNKGFEKGRNAASAPTLGGPEFNTPTIPFEEAMKYAVQPQADEPKGLTPEWIWGELMDYCKERGVAPALNDRLFKIVERARSLLIAKGERHATDR